MLFRCSIDDRPREAALGTHETSDPVDAVADELRVSAAEEEPIEAPHALASEIQTRAPIEKRIGPFAPSCGLTNSYPMTSVWSIR